MDITSKGKDLPLEPLPNLAAATLPNAKPEVTRTENRERLFRGGLQARLY